MEAEEEEEEEEQEAKGVPIPCRNYAFNFEEARAGGRRSSGGLVAGPAAILGEMVEDPGRRCQHGHRKHRHDQKALLADRENKHKHPMC